MYFSKAVPHYCGKYSFSKSESALDFTRTSKGEQVALVGGSVGWSISSCTKGLQFQFLVKAHP